MKSLLKYLRHMRTGEKVKPMTVSQEGIQAIWKKQHPKKSPRFFDRIKLGVMNGRITTGECAGKYPSKDLSRDIKAGYFTTRGPNGGGDVWETNPLTGIKYKVYFWTGKLPPGWVREGEYCGRERRKTARGGKA